MAPQLPHRKTLKTTVGTSRLAQRRIFIFGPPCYFKLGPFRKAEVAVVTFSDSDSASVEKFLNPGPKNFQTFKSDSCSDTDCHRCNCSSARPMFYFKNAIYEYHPDSCCWKWKVTPGPGPVFHKFLTPAFQIRSYLCCKPFWYIKKLGYWFRLINNSS